jgi:hypothetical protein
MAERQFENVVDNKQGPSQGSKDRGAHELAFATQPGALDRLVPRAPDGVGAQAHASATNRALASPSPRAPHSLLRLQRQYGNRYVQRVLARASQEGDGAEVSPEVESSIERARGGGQALDAGVRMQMESAFGADFGAVRAHTGAEAHSLNQAVNAVAFTTGRDIFFRQGEYNPSSSNGRELLAHELTHVVQQNAAPPISAQVQPVSVRRMCPASEGEGKAQAKLTVSQPQDADEVEAEGTAKTVVDMLSSVLPDARRTPSGEPQVSPHAAILGRGLQLAQQENNSAAIQLLERSMDSISAQPERHPFSPPGVLQRLGGGGCSCGGHCPKCRANQQLPQATSQNEGLHAVLARQTLARDGDGKPSTIQCINSLLSNAGIPWAVIAILGGVCAMIGGIAGLAGGPAAPGTVPGGAAVAAAACIAGVTGLTVGMVLGIITKCIQDPTAQWKFAQADAEGGAAAGDGDGGAASDGAGGAVATA